MNVKMVKIVFAALAAVFAVLFFTLGPTGTPSARSCSWDCSFWH